MDNKRANKTGNKLLFNHTISFLILILASLLFSRVVLSNILATSGQRLSAANLKAKALQEENQKLENKISELNSLSRVEKLAQKKGLVKTENVSVLVAPGPIAKR